MTISHPVARSHDLLRRSEALIPGASQTLSKGPSQWVQGVAPAFIERAYGAYVWDADGQRYLDLPMALGPVLLGHRHPAVYEAIREQLEYGITFTLPHRLEVEVAERLAEMIPGAELIRFAKTGSDATTAAVRLARIFTGREHVIATGYHGCADWYMASQAYRDGVPRALGSLITLLPFNDLERLERWLRQRETACVIVEPVGATVPSTDDLQAMIEIAHRYGTLMIFDEVVTGFRIANGGAQAHYGIQADLACFGKALGNGMPVSAVTGRGDVMKHAMFLSFTHAGETLSLAAAKATLDVLASQPVSEHLWDLGRRLMDGVDHAINYHGLKDRVRISGLPPRSIVTINEPKPGRELWAKSLVQQEMVRRGVLFNGHNLVSYAHTQDAIDVAVKAYDQALGVLAGVPEDEIANALEGTPIRAVFWAGART